MSTERAKRLMKEIKECQSDEDSTVYCEAIDGKIDNLKGLIKGPSGSNYEKGWFVLDIKPGYQYPFYPPTITFDTQIWHPNISSETGVICLDILKKEWSPALTIKTAMLSIQALLQSPEPDDPQDAVVASQMRDFPQEFTQNARFWTESFAGSIHPIEGTVVQRLCDMGFYKMRVILTLILFDLDENKALDALVNG